MFDPQLRRTAVNIPNLELAAPLMVPVALPADTLKLPRRELPATLFTTKPQPKKVPLAALSLVVSEPAAGMEHGEVVEDQHVSGLEAELQGVLACRDMHRIEGLGLDLSHGGHGGVMGGEMRARKRPAGELEDWAMAWEVVEEWAIVVLTLKKSDFGKFNLSELRLTKEGYRRKPTHQTPSRPWPAPR